MSARPMRRAASVVVPKFDTTNFGIGTLATKTVDGHNGALDTEQTTAVLRQRDATPPS